MFFLCADSKNSSGGHLLGNDCHDWTFKDHALMELGIVGDVGQVRSKIRPLNFKEASFQLFKEMINRIPWETYLGDKESEQSWQISREVFHRVSELTTPRNRKSGKEGKRWARLKRDLLVRAEVKEQMHRHLKLE